MGVNPWVLHGGRFTAPLRPSHRGKREVECPPLRLFSWASSEYLNDASQNQERISIGVSLRNFFLTATHASPAEPRGDVTNAVRLASLRFGPLGTVSCSPGRGCGLGCRRKPSSFSWAQLGLPGPREKHCFSPRELFTAFTASSLHLPGPHPPDFLGDGKRNEFTRFRSAFRFPLAVSSHQSTAPPSNSPLWSKKSSGCNESASATSILCPRSKALS